MLCEFEQGGIKMVDTCTCHLVSYCSYLDADINMKLVTEGEWKARNRY